MVLIGTYLKLRSSLGDIDTVGLYDYPLPRVAATEADIQRVEHEVGYRLPAHYRDFLLCVSGWEWFFNDIDLLGASELVEGEKARRAREALANTENAALEEVGLDAGDLLPVGVARHSADLMLLVTKGEEAGAVHWFCGGSIEVFPNFEAFIRSMYLIAEDGVEELREVVASLKADGVTKVER